MKSSSIRFSLVATAMATVLSFGCSTLGGTASEPEGNPHNGTGPFADLTASSTNLSNGVMENRNNMAIESVMYAGGQLYFAGAPLRTDLVMPSPDAGSDASMDGGSTDTGMADAGVSDSGVSDSGPRDAGPTQPPGVIDWSLFQARRIFRSVPFNSVAFAEGDVILQAQHAWEGSFVRDPWAVPREDGSIRLYYVAADGLGLAEASSPNGSFVSRNAPLFPATGIRRPSLVRDPRGGSDAMLLYYEEAGEIYLRTTSDGLAFSPASRIDLPKLAARDDRDGDEISRGGPGLAWCPTAGGREILRLYYESRRSNGKTLLAMAASDDGRSFEAHPRPVVVASDRRSPSVRPFDDRISFLYQIAPRSVSFNGQPIERGSVVGGVAPRATVVLPQELNAP